MNRLRVECPANRDLKAAMSFASDYLRAHSLAAELVVEANLCLTTNLRCERKIDWLSRLPGTLPPYCTITHLSYDSTMMERVRSATRIQAQMRRFLTQKRFEITVTLLQRYFDAQREMWREFCDITMKEYRALDERLFTYVLNLAEVTKNSTMEEERTERGWLWDSMVEDWSYLCSWQGGGFGYRGPTKLAQSQDYVQPLQPIDQAFYWACEASLTESRFRQEALMKRLLLSSTTTSTQLGFSLRALTTLLFPDMCGARRSGPEQDEEPLLLTTPPIDDDRVIVARTEITLSEQLQRLQLEAFGWHIPRFVAERSDFVARSKEQHRVCVAEVHARLKLHQEQRMEVLKHVSDARRFIVIINRGDFL